MFPFPRGLCSPSSLPSSSRPLKGCKLMKKGVKQGLFVPWCRCEPPKRTEAAFCSLRFFKTPPPKLRQSAARLQRRKMIFDNLVFKKRNISSGRQGRASREVRRAESHMPGGGSPYSFLLKLEGTERSAELRAAGLLHHQPATWSRLVCGCCKGRGTYQINGWPQCRSEPDKSQRCWHF